MIFFYLSIILLGIFSVHTSEIKDSIWEINGYLSNSEEYKNLSTLLSKHTVWEGLKKHLGNFSLDTIHSEIYKACRNTYKTTLGKTPNTLRGLKLLDYCEKLNDPKFLKFDDFPYAEFARTLAKRFEILHYADWERKNEKAFSLISTPAKFAKSLAEIIKKILDAPTQHLKADLVNQLKKACDPDPNIRDGSNKDVGSGNKPLNTGGGSDEDVGRGNKPWSSTQMAGLGMGIGAAVIIICVVIFNFMTR